jgi:hypothetical protein
VVIVRSLRRGREGQWDVLRDAITREDGSGFQERRDKPA